MSTEHPQSRAERRHAEARRRNLFIGGGIVVALVIAAAVVFFVTRDSDDDGNQAATATAPTATGETTGASGGTQPTDTTNAEKPLAGGVCAADQLAGSVVTSGVKPQAQSLVLAFTNQSKTACTVNGAPEVKLVDADGKALPSNLTVGGGAVPPELVAAEVTVAPGESTSFVMTFNPLPKDVFGCSKPEFFEVTMPGSKGTVKVDTEVTVCSGGSMWVSPMQPGVTST